MLLSQAEVDRVVRYEAFLDREFHRLVQEFHFWRTTHTSSKMPSGDY